MAGGASLRIPDIRAHEVQQYKNYHMWSLFSKQSDGLVQLDPANNNVDCKGAFSDETGGCSLCFNFLSFSVFFFCVLVFVCHIQFFIYLESLLISPQL